MNKEAIDLLIQKRAELGGAREKLQSMQPGAYCMHRSWGFGIIKGYDEADAKLVIDFEGGKDGHKMDPVFCVNHLEILEKDNILVRLRTDTKNVEEMIKKRPADLVAEILSSMPGQEATPTELEAVLLRLLGATRFKKWWTQAKKALVKDPRIGTPARKTDPYVLREEPLKPEEEILEDFYVLKQPKKKIALAEKLYQISENVMEIEEDLPNIFEHLTDAIKKAHGLTQAERLHGVWVRNNLARHLKEDPETIEPTSKSLIMEADNLPELAAEIPLGYQKRFLDLLTRTYPDKWMSTIIDIMRNSSGKMTSESISFLVEREQEEEVAKHLRRWLGEQNIKGPVLLWVIKNRGSRKFAKIVEGLISPRFLSNVLYAIDNEALQNTSNRRIALADILSDDTTLIADMLAEADEEEARDLAQSLLLNQGFEELTKKSLMARFIKAFPSIQSLLSGSSEDNKAEELIVSQKSLDLRKAEYEELNGVKIPENKLAIETAREHGDLRENAEYKMARQDQDTLMARKAQLERDFSRARVTDFTDVLDDAVSVGTIVALSNDGAKAETYAIMGAWDSTPEDNILSYKTPLGQALLGKGVGATVTTQIDGNETSWTIKKISRWVDSGRSL